MPTELFADRYDFRVETPWMYISASAATSAFSLR